GGPAGPAARSGAGRAHGARRPGARRAPDLGRRGPARARDLRGTARGARGLVRKKIKELHGKKFVRDALVLQVATFVQGGSYLATSVLTTRVLGMHEKGRWDTARDIFGVLYFFVTM